MRILIADQQVDVREAICLLLEETLSGSDFWFATNSLDVIDIISSACIDALVVDWELVSRDLFTRVRMLCPRTRIIVLSVRPEIRPEVLKLGVDAFVCKGDPPEYLLDALHNPA